MKNISLKISKFIISKRYFSLNLQKYFVLEISKNEYCEHRVDKFVINHFNLNWTMIQKLFRTKDIFLMRGENEKIRNPKEKLKLNDKIYISNRIVEKANMHKSYRTSDLEYLDQETQNLLIETFKNMIVLNSRELLIIDKMPNLASQDGTKIKFSIDTMLQLMNIQSDKYKLKLVHRLDRNVCGLMIIGNEIEAVRKLGEYLEDRKITKTYITLVQGIPIHLKHLLCNGNINSNNFSKLNSDNFLSSSLRGFIKSNESCDKSVIELENENDFIFQEKFYFQKNGTYTPMESPEMFGKFEISHFIEYDQKSQRFNMFNLDKFMYYDTKAFEKLYLLLEKIKRAYKESLTLEDCYTIIKYDLGSGKRHQIRKHMSKVLFTPIFNDDNYSFDSTLAKNGLKMFNGSKPENYVNSLCEKYNIGYNKSSIMLQSLNISLPKMKLSEMKIDKKKISIHETEDQLNIKSNKLSENFRRLFENMKIDINDIYKL